MALDSDSFLPDAEDCAEAWRQLRWDKGLYCPECGSDQVQTRQQNYRDHLHRYCCEACGKWFIFRGRYVSGSLQREPTALGLLRARDGQGASLRADQRRNRCNEENCATDG
jgi:transposase-like protein